MPSPEGAFPPTVAVTFGRAGRLARHVAGIRTTTPALSSCGTSWRKRKASLGFPAQRMEDLARVDHGFQPRADFGRALNGQEQRQQAILVRCSGVFAQRLAERKMLGFGVGGKPGGVGGEKREGSLFILAVFGEIEVHAAHQVPRGVAALEEVLDRASRLR